jgi:hypothetical protein
MLLPHDTTIDFFFFFFFFLFFLLNKISQNHINGLEFGCVLFFYKKKK